LRAQSAEKWASAAGSRAWNTWEAADEGRAQRQIWDAVAQLLQKRHCVALGRPIHGQKGQIGDVLQGDVDIFANLPPQDENCHIVALTQPTCSASNREECQRAHAQHADMEGLQQAWLMVLLHLGVACNLIDEGIREVRRIRIENAYPMQPFQLPQLRQEFCQTVAILLVHAIPGHMKGTAFTCLVCKQSVAGRPAVQVTMPAIVASNGSLQCQAKYEAIGHHIMTRNYG
jgi:hypothetical protein